MSNATAYLWALHPDNIPSTPLKYAITQDFNTYYGVGASVDPLGDGQLNAYRVLCKFSATNAGAITGDLKQLHEGNVSDYMMVPDSQGYDINGAGYRTLQYNPNTGSANYGTLQLYQAHLTKDNVDTIPILRNGTGQGDITYGNIDSTNGDDALGINTKSISTRGTFNEQVLGLYDINTVTTTLGVNAGKDYIQDHIEIFYLASAAVGLTFDGTEDPYPINQYSPTASTTVFEGTTGKNIFIPEDVNWTTNPSSTGYDNLGVFGRLAQIANGTFRIDSTQVQALDIQVTVGNFVPDQNWLDTYINIENTVSHNLLDPTEYSDRRTDFKVNSDHSYVYWTLGGAYNNASGCWGQSIGRGSNLGPPSSQTRAIDLTNSVLYATDGTTAVLDWSNTTDWFVDWDSANEWYPLTGMSIGASVAAGSGVGALRVPNGGGYFGDGLYVTDGTRVVELCTSTVAGNFVGASKTVDLATSSYAVDATLGGINTQDAYYVDGVQVLSNGISVGATPSSNTAGATYGTNEQTMLQEAHDAARVTMAAGKTHKFLIT
jgi:hypothetical protein